MFFGGGCRHSLAAGNVGRLAGSRRHKVAMQAASRDVADREEHKQAALDRPLEHQWGNNSALSGSRPNTVAKVCPGLVS